MSRVSSDAGGAAGKKLGMPRETCGPSLPSGEPEKESGQEEASALQNWHENDLVGKGFNVKRDDQGKAH